MKRFFLPVLFMALVLAGCSKQFKLKTGTPVYTFAKDIAAKLPYLEPDKNNVLVSTKKFKITSGEVIEEIFSTYGKSAEQLKTMSPEQVKFYVEQMALNLGEKKMLLQQVEKAKITVSPTAVDSVLNSLINQKGGKKSFDEEINRLGINQDLIKRDVQTQLILDRYFRKHFEKELQVTEQDIQQAYSEGKTATVRHILLLTKNKDDAEKSKIYQKMEMIQARINKGEDFARLANQYSEDPGSNKKGGLVENFQRGDMMPAFDEASFTVPIGEVSNILETDYGYHILKVIDRKKDSRPLNSLRAEIQKQVEQKKRRELAPKIQALVDQLKQENVFTVMKF